MVNFASQFKVVIAYEAYLFSNASLSRPSWPHVSEVLPAICNLREKLVPHCDCNIILHNSNSKPVWTSPIGKWVKKGRKKNRKILKKRSVSGAFCESSTLGSGGAWGVRHLERYKVIVAHLIWLRRKRRKQEQQTKFKKVCWGRYSWYWMRARYSATVWKRPAESYATWYRATCYVLRATVQRTR